MKTPIRITIALALALPLLIVAGCEDSNVLAPSDGQIVLTANPAAVQLDPDGLPPIREDTTTITAQIFDAEGRPVSQAVIVFTTTGGRLASTPAAGQPPVTIETNENGIATDVLTVNEDDPDSIQVTATSGTLIQSVTVEKIEVQQNDPVADLFAVPADQQFAGDPVIFDGSDSFDPDGDRITCYQWELSASAAIQSPPDGPFELNCDPPSSRCTILQGPNRSVISASFSVHQSVSVVLRVSDIEGVNCSRQGPVEPDSVFSPLVASLSYEICDNTRPQAVAGDNKCRALDGAPSVEVVLDGSNSSDPESSIEFWRWSCGNGTAPINVAQSAATCRYGATGQFTATLTVENECGLIGTDTLTVTIVDLPADLPGPPTCP